MTALGTVLAVTAYGILTSALMAAYSDGITAAGSSFAGMGMAALPAVIVYSFIRTGFSEEFLFRGFLLKRISRRWGFIVGNTVQALLFGARTASRLAWRLTAFRSPCCSRCFRARLAGISAGSMKSGAEEASCPAGCCMAS